MLQSRLFTKTRKELPADEASKNAQLLIRAGYVHKEMAGAYSFLPLGLRVLERIKGIVREEMNGIGGQEIIMTALQRKELWERTNRWDDKQVDIWFKSQLKSGGDVGFGWSHEEPITDMMKSFIGSYRDLPVYVYQFQTKLRNELRAKSGLMRGREFVMKDLYSYSANEEEHRAFYEAVTAAYMRVFERIGLGDKTFFTFASGGAFTEFSHEFQTLTDAGEDVIYLHRGKKIAVNKEVLSEKVLDELGLKQSELEEVRAAEVGNIFSFGGKKSEELGLMFRDEKGEQKPAILGSYGIGITRAMGVLAELFADERGIVWPKEVAPYDVHLLLLPSDDEAVEKEASALYERLQNEGIHVLYDERKGVSAGEKFADADLIGIPVRAVISEKSMKAGGIEVKGRTEEKAVVMDAKKLLSLLKK
ncbi:MAG: aminoacyl--tRNA ligase-related protein [bacterium]|nr:aminoacyl--tRNA ligase-related protein [bacterium]